MSAEFSKEYLDQFHLDGLISDPLGVDLYDVSDELTAAAKAADEKGKLDQALVYRLLNSIAQLHFRPEEKAEPYGPLATFANGSRTPQGSDFTRDQCEALFGSLTRIRSVALKARIADLTWLNDRSKSDAARTAIDSMVTLAEASLRGEAKAKHGDLHPGNHLITGLLNRALSIAFATGWDREENEGLRAVLKAFYEGAKLEAGPNFSRAAELLLRTNSFSAIDIFVDAMSLGEAAKQAENFDEAEWAFARAVSAAVVAKDTGAGKAAKLALSEALEAKAEKAPAGFLKTHALEQAIDALKGSKDVRDRRRELHLKLADAQADVHDDLGVIEHEMDISDLVEQTRATFRPLSLFECLREFALIALPRDPEKIIEEARQMAQRFILSGLFPAVILDERGRTVAREGSAAIGEASRHAILRNESVYTGIAVRGQIEHAREIIYADKRLTEAHLIALCRLSPFVPPHAQVMLGEGLYAFFQREYAKAGAFVIPYLESCLRHILERSGEPSTVIKEGGVESNLMLGTLLGKHRADLEKVLTANFVLAIENLFDHPLGDKIRHQHAHGMLSRGHYFSHNVIYAIWLIYSIIILPMLNQWEDVERIITQEVAV